MGKLLLFGIILFIIPFLVSNKKTDSNLMLISNIKQ